jgi:hypothetical protein
VRRFRGRRRASGNGSFQRPWARERPRDCRPIKLCAMIVDQDDLAVIGQNIALGHDFAQPINEGIQ